MKKKIVFSLLVLLVAASVFAKPTNSKIGYFDLKWGSTVQDAENAGYKLTNVNLLPQAEDFKENLKEKYVADVDEYIVMGKDKTLINPIFFYYYEGKLFEVSEYVKIGDDVKKLESRYGKFKDNGIVQLGEAYTDNVLDSNGNVLQKSIFIMKIDTTGTPHEKYGTIITNAVFYNWDVYKNISVYGREQAGIGF